MKIFRYAFCRLSKVCLALLASLLLIAAAQTHSSDPPVGFVQHAASWSHNFTVYNKAFAKRFGLDVKKAIPLSKGLQAMQVYVKKTPKYPPFNKKPDSNIIEYECTVRLFVDSNLAIRYPDNLPYSSLNAAQTAAGEISAFPNMSPDDRQALWEKANKGYDNATAGLFYQALDKNGSIPFDKTTWGTYSGYNQEPLKGISYIKLGSGCDVLAHVNDQTTLWLKKRGFTKYDESLRDGVVKPNLKAYYHFKVPVVLSHWAYIRYGACVNWANVEADNHKFSPNYFPEPRKCVKPT